VLTQEEQDTFHSWAVTAVERFGTRATILRETSWQAAQRFGPSAFDFVFLDGDHSYSGVVADISAWASKIKPRGLLCGHDYYADFKERPFPKIEVRRAVDEFVAAAGLQLELGGDMTWFVRMP
jgi:predicted O-methyltransferase YrrM